MPTELLINIKDLTWGYPGSPNLIFNDFSFDLHKKDFCFVMGKSGVGKTTLAKHIIGQIQAPANTIFHKGYDISGINTTNLQMYKRKIGVIFQDYKLIENKTVGENVSYPLEIAGVKEDEVERKLIEVLDRLGILEKKDSLIYHLSGGEKQKVAIARALIVQPEFIIADEPTGNLDRNATKEIADILIDFNNAGNTIIFITHDQELIKYAQQKHKTKTFNL